MVIEANNDNKDNLVSVSPLEETNEFSLDEFMSRDPFGYTKHDRVQVIKLLREQRAKWESLESQGKKQSKATAKTGGASTRKSPKTPPIALSLDDLFGEDLEEK